MKQKAILLFLFVFIFTSSLFSQTHFAEGELVEIQAQLELLYDKWNDLRGDITQEAYDKMWAANRTSTLENDVEYFKEHFEYADEGKENMDKHKRLKFKFLLLLRGRADFNYSELAMELLAHIMLNDSSAEVRADAADLLSSGRQSEQVRLRQQVRGQIIEAMNIETEKAVIDALINTIKNFKYNDPEIRDVLIEKGLGHSDVDIRMHAWTTINENKITGEKVGEAFVTLYNSTSEASLKTKALFGLSIEGNARVAGSRAVVIDGLRSENPFMVYYAAKAAITNPGELVGKALLETGIAAQGPERDATRKASMIALRQEGTSHVSGIKQALALTDGIGIADSKISVQTEAVLTVVTGDHIDAEVAERLIKYVGRKNGIELKITLIEACLADDIPKELAQKVIEGIYVNEAIGEHNTGLRDYIAEGLEFLERSSEASAENKGRLEIAGAELREDSRESKKGSRGGFGSGTMNGAVREARGREYGQRSGQRQGISSLDVERELEELGRRKRARQVTDFEYNQEVQRLLGKRAQAEARESIARRLRR
ncbi:MAG: hypothetical protein ABIA04_04810 [Pseudomonadota bacterium]